MGRETLMPDELFDATESDYVHAIVAGGHLHVSGQVATDADGEVVGDDIETQTRQVFDNLGGILEAAGRTFDDVVKVTSYLDDIERDYEGFKSVYGEVFDGRLPCHTMIGVERLANDEFLVEVEIEVPMEA